MSPAARERIVGEASAALAAQQEAMGEGSPHGRAKARAWRLLGDFFFRSHRLAYLNSELPVLYPGEEVFCPDLLGQAAEAAQQAAEAARADAEARALEAEAARQALVARLAELEARLRREG